MVEQIFNQATFGISSGIQIDVMLIITTLINIGLLLLGCRIIYGIIKGETIEGHIQGMLQGMKDRHDESEYEEIYAEEKEKYRIAQMRMRARNEIRGE